MRLRVAALVVLLATMLLPQRSFAIDFYEIQIYPVETAPPGHLMLELHSNTVSTASGAEARSQLNPYQIHETLEATYGLFQHLEVGQYLCTARLGSGNYEYAGARTKVHFGGIGDPDASPIALGANVELDYMRHAAEENPMTLELRPIAEKRLGKLWLVGDFVFEKPFSGPQTHRGFTFQPSALVSYDLFQWLTPGLEYYGDMGPLRSMPAAERQQHFIFPTLNLHLAARLELNLGVGIGVTRASNGTILKSIVGWTF